MGSKNPMMAQLAQSFMGMNGGEAAPVRQMLPQVQQSQGAPQQSPMQSIAQLFMNQMVGMKPSSPRPQPNVPAVSPRDALIQSLMGGGYGR